MQPSGHLPYVLTETKIDVAKPDIATARKGTYTGTGVANRAIPHGLGVTPAAVFIRRTDGTVDRHMLIMDDRGILIYNGVIETVTLAAMDATNFYVDASYMNSNALEYDWTALK